MENVDLKKVLTESTDQLSVKKIVMYTLFSLLTLATFVWVGKMIFVDGLAIYFIGIPILVMLFMGKLNGLFYFINRLWIDFAISTNPVAYAKSLIDKDKATLVKLYESICTVGANLNEIDRELEENTLELKAMGKKYKSEASNLSKEGLVLLKSRMVTKDRSIEKLTEVKEKMTIALNQLKDSYNKLELKVEIMRSEVEAYSCMYSAVRNGVDAITAANSTAGSSNSQETIKEVRKNLDADMIKLKGYSSKSVDDGEDYLVDERFEQIINRLD